MKDVLLGIVASTGWTATIFGVSAMSTATGMWAWRPEHFTSANWLTALATCAGLLGTSYVKRMVDNSKLAKPGVGDGGA